MAKKFFIFFNVANIDFFTLHALFFDVAYVIFKCFKKIACCSTFTHVAAGIFTAIYHPMLGRDFRAIAVLKNQIRVQNMCPMGGRTIALEPSHKDPDEEVFITHISAGLGSAAGYALAQSALPCGSALRAASAMFARNLFIACASRVACVLEECSCSSSSLSRQRSEFRPFGIGVAGV